MAILHSFAVTGPNDCTVDPVMFAADEDEGLAGVIGALEMALKDARERPVLDYAQFEAATQAQS